MSHSIDSKVIALRAIWDNTPYTAEVSYMDVSIGPSFDVEHAKSIIDEGKFIEVFCYKEINVDPVDL